MKIIIIILICLFFSLSIPTINEFLIPTAGPPPAPNPTAGPSPQDANTPNDKAPASAQPQADSGGLQAQVNMLSTQITTTNAVALEAKKKVDDISSQIDKLKEELQKPPTD
jgi:peptidoglycan hydrolase CwlO-like protein